MFKHRHPYFKYFITYNAKKKTINRQNTFASNRLEGDFRRKTQEGEDFKRSNNEQGKEDITIINNFSQIIIEPITEYPQ